tara:strand:- start:18 stop:395 length:378 start_codon:yes stop_codon:yes gene_type:complete
MQALGKHILVDLYECPSELLNDVEHIEASMQKAARRAGATILNSNFHRFSPHGVTGVLTIQESHLAIHTWPEYGYAAVDLFTCGQTINPWRAYEVLKEELHAERATAVEMHRGQSDMLPARRRLL